MPDYNDLQKAEIRSGDDPALRPRPAPIVEGGTAAAAFRNALDLAQHAERWGYTPLLAAEHHNMPGIASAATAVLIGHIGAGHIDDPDRRRRHHAAEHTRRCRWRSSRHARVTLSWVGSILASAARPAPITPPLLALRRTLQSESRRVSTRRHRTDRVLPRSAARATSACGSRRRPESADWILGSSLFGAQVAAALGLPFSFASHFAPQTAA
jgi:hypothetical protein